MAPRAPGVSRKDIVLAIVATLGTGGGAGYVIEYRGEAIRDLSMEGRMTVCNMSIEAGARAGLVAVDDTTIEYLRARPSVPRGDEFDVARERWRTFVTDDDAVFDAELVLDAPTNRALPHVGNEPRPGRGPRRRDSLTRGCRRPR